MLDDGHGGLGEVVGGAECCVGVDEVVVAHGLAVDLVGLGDACRGCLVHIERGLLVRVLAVAKHLGAFQGEAGVGGPVDDAVAVLVEELAGGPGGHSGVVGGGVRERLCGEAAAGLEVETALGGGADHVAVERRVHHNGDGGVVLSGGAHHGGASDVDLLHDVVLRGTGLDRLHERVEVHHDEVEGLDLHLGEGLHVGGDAAVGEDAAVDARVQGLDPAVEHLGGTGDLFDFLDRDAGRGDLLGGRAGGNNLDACCVQALGELLQTGLVVYRDQGPADGNTVKLRQAHKSLRLYLAVDVPRLVGIRPSLSCRRAPACWRPQCEGLAVPGVRVGPSGRSRSAAPGRSAT